VWFDAVAAARRWIHFENHIFSEDKTGEMFAEALIAQSVQIRDGKLGDAEIVALGGPQAAGIPGPNTRPTLQASRTGTTLPISWDAWATGFVLESKDSLANPNWSSVPGVANNSVTVPTSGPPPMRTEGNSSIISAGKALTTQRHPGGPLV
jgi:hypothetical protein